MFPLLLAGATPVYVSLYRAVEGNIALVNLARFAVCFALIFLPTFLMGGTLPVLLKRFVGDRRGIGAETGLLYGINTAGAVAGMLACGYLLLRVLGMQSTTWIAVAINLAVAALAWILGRAEAPSAAGGGQQGQPGRAAPVKAAATSPATVRLVLIGIGLSGFCALAYEVFWTRMLNLFVNNNVYSFTAILGTFLTGIALGSLVYSRFLRNVTRPVLLFAGLKAGIGVLSFATPYIFNLLHGSLFLKRTEVLTLAKTAVIMLGPTILMGIAVPLAVQICQRGARREGTSVGTVYAVNTVGAILGAFAAGFVLLPRIGLSHGLLVVAVLNLLAALLAVAAVATRRVRTAWVAAFAVIVVATFLASPPTLFRGIYQKTYPDADLLHYKEGRVANVVVYDFVKAGWKDLFLNGVEEASSRLWHVQLFKMLGILPPMVHPKPDEALMVAFGAGMSAGAAVDQVEHLDCVDLNPDIEGVAEVFSKENRDVLHHPNFELIVNDGRNALLLDERDYSLIISDATNPKTFDSWTLYTREFYQLVKERLEPDGVFCQWVLIPLPSDSMKVLLNTFRSVFPHASFWCIYGSTQCMMLATPERLSIDYQTLATRLEPAFEGSDLAAYGIEDVDKFLSFFLLGEDGLAAYLGDFDTINTDDLPIAQFRVKQDLEGINDSGDIIRNQESILPYLTNLPPDRQATEERLEALRELSRRLNWGFVMNDEAERNAARRFAAFAGLARDANVASALFFDRERERYFRARLETHPDDANAHNSLGHIAWMKGDHDLAIERLERAVELDPEFAVAQANLARVYRDAGRHDEAAAGFLALSELDPSQGTMAMVQRELGRIPLLRRLRYEPESAGLYRSLMRSYLEEDDLIRAEAAAVNALAHDETDVETWLALARIYDRIGFAGEALEAYQRTAGLAPDNFEAAAKVAELMAVQAHEPMYREWLNRGRYLVRDEAAETEEDHHPRACLLAREAWNDVPFEGHIGEESLRRAASLFVKATEEQPDGLHAYADAGRILEALGDYAGAATAWRRGLAVSPDNPFAIATVRRLDLLNLIDRGEVDSTDLPGVLLEIGSQHRRTGAIQRAIELFEKAAAAGSEDAWIELATSRAGTGRYESAIEAYERALELASEETIAAGIRERIGAIRELLARAGAGAVPAAG